VRLDQAHKKTLKIVLVERRSFVFEKKKAGKLALSG
jgi:hypothetical protein